MSFRLSSSALLSSTLCLAIAAGACGGAAHAPSGDTSPPSLEPAADTTPSPATPATPAPKYPVGPYTGAVATTDVSILYPLPTSAHANDLVRASSTGSHGALLPQ